MATKKNTGPASSATVERPAAPEEYVEIGKLRAKHRISPALYVGVCSAQGWKPGKAVTECEFLEAVRSFDSAPMGGLAKKEAMK